MAPDTPTREPEMQDTPPCPLHICWCSSAAERSICNADVEISEFSTSSSGNANIQKEEVNMKEITKEEINALIKNGVIHNGHRGFVNKSGNTIGFYRTRNRRYIEDKYADIAKRYM